MGPAFRPCVMEAASSGFEETGGVFLDVHGGGRQSACVCEGPSSVFKQARDQSVMG